MKPSSLASSGWKAALLWALPVSLFAQLLLFPGPAWSAAALLKVGLMEEPKTLNVLKASDRWSRKVLGEIHQTLLVREPENQALTPWLASELPIYDPSAVSYTVKLRPAKWSDGSDLTSDDVAFTGSIIMEFKVPGYIDRWDFINKIETPDKHTVVFYLKEPDATFLARTMTTPIIQKKQWEPVAQAARGKEKPLASLLEYNPEIPVGCGPFVLKEWRQGAYVYLQKNPLFFGTGLNLQGRVLGPYIDGAIFKFFGTADAAILALKKGTIDIFWWGIQPGYLDDLKKDENIEVFFNERSAVYFIGFNLRKAPFSDPALRRAIATLIDKDFIISRILQGYGDPMDSIVPAGNRLWYCAGLPTYGKGLSREERTKKAVEILRQAGYTWETPPVDGSRKVVEGRGIRLPNGQPMENVTILTPPADYDPLRAMTGMIVQEWLRAAGIPASAKPMAFSAMLDQVKVRNDFDAFILAYGALSLDPDYLSNFFHSQNAKPRGWNMSGYKNPEFDSIADASAKAMNEKERQALVWKMQQIVMADVPYIPLYNPKLIEAVRKGRFTGWVQAIEGVGNSWSYCVLKPK
jgi:ABC-type transport system substrate-binding protein